MLFHVSLIRVAECSTITACLPTRYLARDMKTMHAGMGISSAEFGALVQDLVATLNKFKVPKTEQNELLGLLGPMKSDIVEVP